MIANRLTIDVNATGVISDALDAVLGALLVGQLCIRDEVGTPPMRAESVAIAGVSFPFWNAAWPTVVPPPPEPEAVEQSLRVPTSRLGHSPVALSPPAMFKPLLMQVDAHLVLVPTSALMTWPSDTSRRETPALRPHHRVLASLFLHLVPAGLMTWQLQLVNITFERTLPGRPRLGDTAYNRLADALDRSPPIRLGMGPLVIPGPYVLFNVGLRGAEHSAVLRLEFLWDAVFRGDVDLFGRDAIRDYDPRRPSDHDAAEAMLADTLVSEAMHIGSDWTGPAGFYGAAFAASEAPPPMSGMAVSTAPVEVFVDEASTQAFLVRVIKGLFPVSGVDLSGEPGVSLEFDTVPEPGVSFYLPVVSNGCHTVFGDQRAYATLRIRLALVGSGGPTPEDLMALGPGVSTADVVLLNLWVSLDGAGAEFNCLLGSTPGEQELLQGLAPGPLGEAAEVVIQAILNSQPGPDALDTVIGLLPSSLDSVIGVRRIDANNARLMVRRTLAASLLIPGASEGLAVAIRDLVKAQRGPSIGGGPSLDAGLMLLLDAAPTVPGALVLDDPSPAGFRWLVTGVSCEEPSAALTFTVRNTGGSPVALCGYVAAFDPDVRAYSLTGSARERLNRSIRVTSSSPMIAPGASSRITVDVPAAAVQTFRTPAIFRFGVISPTGTLLKELDRPLLALRDDDLATLLERCREGHRTDHLAGGDRRLPPSGGDGLPRRPGGDPGPGGHVEATQVAGNSFERAGLSGLATLAHVAASGARRG